MTIKNELKGFIIASLIIALSACSDSNEGSSGNMIEKSYTVNRCKVLEITPRIQGMENASYEWSVQPETGNSSLVSKDKTLPFIAVELGNYTVTLKVTDGSSVLSESTRVTVTKESKSYSIYLSQVLDYMPAPGQFVNELPLYETGDTKEKMIRKAEESIKSNKGMITLGGFGGYVVFGFDHTVVNVPGKRDFRVNGNTFTESSEPGVIMVAYDKNKNGKPDENEWYEIAGSEYEKSTKGYQITYSKPDPDKEPVKGNLPWKIDIEYLYWKDNRGGSGYKTKNIYHLQSYYPEWITDKQLTFTGTLLPPTATNEGTEEKEKWVFKTFDWGYADNQPNNHEDSGIDIAWAVDANGTSVSLPGIDFVKVYSGLNQEAGWAGESSTEVTGAMDLHLKQD